MHRKQGGKNSDFVACLQETYIATQGKIPYIWRGNFHLTPGNGHSCGCLTLLSPHLSIIESKALSNNRGHIVAVQKAGDTDITYVIGNIYAPNPNSQEKLDFFEEVFDGVLEFQEKFSCENALILGDYNLVLKESETKNRTYSAQERNVASFVTNLLSTSNMADSWSLKKGFTWRRPGTDIFSTIDRISFSKNSFSLISINDNWSLSCSDHAAVEATFSIIASAKGRRTRITRLDPYLAKVEWSRLKIEKDFMEMYATAPRDWDPHLKLDYAKMCIRTVVEQVQAERKRTEKSEEETINEELDIAISRLGEGSLIGQSLGSLIEHTETLRARKAQLVEEKGKRLAEKLGTKWYNEGEKSTKYFLRLLNRSFPDDFKTILGEGGEVSEPKEIEEEIVTFYKKLYENYDSNDLQVLEDDDDFFNHLQSISDDAQQDIVRPITLADVTATLMTCVDSAPGPDGIPYSIIRTVWSTFGPLLCEAWNHSLVTGKLPISHRTSYLKLIPKAGKDLRLLTNWRPITLSNCDHKLITKCYANRMCKNVAPVISGCQTAYIKERLINDNVRAMLASINITNVEEAARGLLVSLDAKKAFDSVEHSYIERCLKELGCANFIPIFRVLYSELSTDILVNGRIVKGFNIKRGVKQGDALSCIIFIICMEPLIRNLEASPGVEPISTRLLGNLPKTYAYADDVNCTIKDSQECLEQVFQEYEKLSKRSGLVLNADKTEIMRLGTNVERSYDVNYMDVNYCITSKAQVKINGISFHRDYAATVQANVKLATARMDKQFKSWSRRSLSLLGKILIAKTYGISQLVYVMQSVELKNCHYKLINNLLYKFIWNRHYLAAKAPERIKREIMCKPIKLGGFGMLDVADLDESLKIKSVGRLISSNHPYITVLRRQSNLRNYFNPKSLIEIDIDPFHRTSLELTGKLRELVWKNKAVERNCLVHDAVRRLDISTELNRAGKLSLAFFGLRVRGKTKIGDLTQAEFGLISRFLDRDKTSLISLALGTRPPTQGDITQTLVIKGRHKDISKCTSKEIRESRNTNDLKLDLKLGPNLSALEALSWGNKISKLTSI